MSKPSDADEPVDVSYASHELCDKNIGLHNLIVPLLCKAERNGNVILSLTVSKRGHQITETIVS